LGYNLTMQNQENKPTNPMPRRDIPESWVKNGRCPACGAAGLKVTHLPDMADYLSCAKCEISFEVENGGKYVRLKYVPDALEFVDGILYNRWVEASKLAGIIAKNRPAAPQNKAPDQPPAALSDDDVWNRALRMYRLGNTPKMIQLMLLQSGQTQEQANIIFEKLKEVAEEDARLQNRKFWMMAGISLLVIVFITGAWLFASGKVPIMLGLVTATPAPTQAANQPSAIGMLMKLIPAGAQPDLMNLPATRVEKNVGPGRAACPATPETAAKFFGGDSSLWYRDENQFPSWQMINAGDSITVRVPSGMTAGYMDNETFQVQSVQGPATIHNVNFLVITCD
jgi:transcription elongation factor Elf1